jgi:hypothetical protein
MVAISSRNKARRKPSSAQIFRRLDREGAPISWGADLLGI